MEYPIVTVEDDQLWYDNNEQDRRTVIGATSISMGEDDSVVNWHLTLSDGETLAWSNPRGADDVIAALSELPPAAQLPELELPQETSLWDPDKEPQQFERREPVNDEPEPKLEMPSDIPVNGAWADRDDVSGTIAVRSSNYGLYRDQAAIELQIKQAFENTPNWSSLKPDARCALDMFATKISRILTGKPDLHDSWHDIQGYAKLVADRILDDIRAMGGNI